LRTTPSQQYSVEGLYGFVKQQAVSNPLVLTTLLQQIWEVVLSAFRIQFSGTQHTITTNLGSNVVCSSTANSYLKTRNVNLHFLSSYTVGLIGNFSLAYFEQCHKMTPQKAINP
jgi:hypothetical protein